MSDRRTIPPRTPVPPPSKHQLALMIWLAVFPTLLLLNLALRDALKALPIVLRTFVLATVAVPIVIYGLMPHLHRLRAAHRAPDRVVSATMRCRLARRLLMRSKLRGAGVGECVGSLIAGITCVPSYPPPIDVVRRGRNIERAP